MKAWGGRGSIGPPSIFKSIQPIDMKLGMWTKCPVYFQLSVVMWHLIDFHVNGSIEMTFPSVKIVFFNNIYQITVNPSFKFVIEKLSIGNTELYKTLYGRIFNLHVKSKYVGWNNRNKDHLLQLSLVCVCMQFGSHWRWFGEIIGCRVSPP